METGIVKFFNPKKGYGFIATSDPDRDVFLHKTGIPFGILVNTGDTRLLLRSFRALRDLMPRS
ncbi:MAG: cold-shock protein [bacterium]